MKVFLAVLLCFVASFIFAKEENDSDKYASLNALIELQADMASSCKIHIKVYSNMDSKDCYRVYKLRDKIAPYIVWYQKILSNTSKAIEFHKKNDAFNMPPQLDRDLAYIGAFNKMNE